MITFPLHGAGAEFYGGVVTGTSLRAPTPNMVNLAGFEFDIDVKQYRRQGLGSLRQGLGSTGEPSDQLFDTNGSWWRYRHDWRHGAGQPNMDLTQDDDPQRFRRSFRLDPWTEGCLQLHQATALVFPATATEGALVATDQWMYFGSAGGLFRTADLSNWSVPAGAGPTTVSGTVRALTTDGTDIYAATSTGVWRVTAALTPTVIMLTAGNFDNVAFVGNRLLASIAETLYEISATGVLTAIVVHFQPLFRWTTIFNIGSRIYAGGFAGSRSELYSLTALASTGALAQGSEAAPFGSNELLRAGIGYGGAAILATSLGVRFANLSGDGTLTYGPLVADGGNCRALVAEGRFAWFGWPTQPEGRTGLGRMSLDTFATALFPAYAADVSNQSVGADNILAVARFLGRTVYFANNDGIYASSTTAYETSGWLDSGVIFFGTVESKILTSVTVRTEPLAPGESVTAQAIDQNGRGLAAGDLNTESRRSLEVDLRGVEVDRMELHLSMAGTGATSPCVQMWRARAYPVPPSNEQWLVPLLIAEAMVVSDGPGQVRSYDPLSLVEHFVQLWRDKTPVIYMEGQGSYRVRIDNYQLVPWDWQDSSRYFNTAMIVQLVSV